MKFKSFNMKKVLDVLDKSFKAHIGIVPTSKKCEKDYATVTLTYNGGATNLKVSVCNPRQNDYFGFQEAPRITFRWSSKYNGGNIPLFEMVKFNNENHYMKAGFAELHRETFFSHTDFLTDIKAIDGAMRAFAAEYLHPKFIEKSKAILGK